MSQLLKVQLQDNSGNIYYLQTDADSVFLSDGTTVTTALQNRISASAIDNNLLGTDPTHVLASPQGAALAGQITQLNSDINPVIKFLDFTSTGMAEACGTSYSLIFGTFVYVHFGFTIQKTTSDGNDIARIADVPNMQQLSNIAAISQNGSTGTFKVVGMNLQSNAAIPAYETFVFDLIIPRTT